MNVLMVVRDLKRGNGISEWVINYSRLLMDRNKNLHIDLLVDSGEIEIPDGYVDERIKIICFHNISKNPFLYISDWIKMGKKISEYDCIHIHADNFVRFIPLLILRNKSNVIIHSHNSTNKNVENNIAKRILNTVGKNIVKQHSFIKCACSDAAAKWLFDDMEYYQINNGINLDQFEFNAKKRNELRSLHVMNNKSIYAHIGRFSLQKNQSKLIEIFEKIYYEDKNSILLLFGEGDTKKNIKHMVNDKGLNDCVKFMGYKDNINDYLNAFDAIIFPSLYEGLPISLVEAQANGVPVFYSNNITSEIKLTNYAFPIDINASNNSIAQYIVYKMQVLEKIDRHIGKSLLKHSGYSDIDVSDNLYKLYEQISRSRSNE